MSQFGYEATHLRRGCLCLEELGERTLPDATLSDPPVQAMHADSLATAPVELPALPAPQILAAANPQGRPRAEIVADIQSVTQALNAEKARLLVVVGAGQELIKQGKAIEARLDELETQIKNEPDLTKKQQLAAQLVELAKQGKKLSDDAVAKAAEAQGLANNVRGLQAMLQQLLLELKNAPGGAVKPPAIQPVAESDCGGVWVDSGDVPNDEGVTAAEMALTEADAALVAATNTNWEDLEDVDWDTYIESYSF